MEQKFPLHSECRKPNIYSFFSKEFFVITTWK